MWNTGKAVLYLVNDNTEVTNWPGGLRFKVDRLSVGKHNKARVQRTAYFKAADGKRWIGRQYGNNSELIYCRRLKEA